MRPNLPLLAALLLAPLPALHAADHVLFMNSDYNHYFAAAPEVKRGPSDDWVEPMRPEFTVTKKGLENYIDEIARGHLTHFVMNLNCQRANFPSKTFEPIWKSLDEPERDHLDYIRALKALYESGVDPYKVWIDRCRVKGIKPWISIRMNDLHRHDVPESPWISTFWHEHPEYRLRPDGWDNGLDYTLEPVRKRMLDFITEVLDRYDPEGLELDLMRFRRYLPIGREKECAPIFTAYMREIRKVVNAAAAKRGHPITLSVRLKSKPSGSRELGMEADVWAKEGIVDVIVPTSPWESFDFDIPLAEWRTWTGDKVLIVPSADEAITENGKRRIATFEEYRRWASIMQERGAKGLYLFNFFMHPQDGPVWNGVLSGGLAPLTALHAADEDHALNFHLMHPGGESLPGDPNAAFYLDGTYHLHYILAHPWQEKKSFAFVHVTSPDMLHWTWQPTKLQPSFTDHGMFSGTGFITKEGKPAAIYHGQGSGKNQIAIATDRKLSAWEKPYPLEVKTADGQDAKIRHWDPDCFLIGDTYYAISGGDSQPLMKSKDLKTWTLVGDFMKHDMPDVARGEDISCANFFPLGNKWMLLCISHPLGCRYYIGDWDAKAEQFVPQTHGRMNWRRDEQSLFGRPPWRVDFFAPESLLTPDGRRVMWAWLATLGKSDGTMDGRTIQSLPRELSLPADGILRIKPLRELETLRHAPVTLSDITISDVTKELLPTATPAGKKIATLDGDANELRITIPRDQAERKLFGFTLFPDGKGGGLPILFRPETGTLRVGTTEAPFSIAALPKGEDVELRIFIDKYLVEVFANDRQAMVASHAAYSGKPDLNAFTVGAPTTIKKLEIWKLQPTNQGFREAQKNRVWEPNTK